MKEEIVVLNRGLLVMVLIALAFLAGCAPAGGTGAQDSSLYMVFFIILLFGVFYFFTIRPQRKRQKAHQELVQSLQKGDKVIIAGGIMGEIVSLDENTALVKVDSGATMRVLRGYIVGKQP
ncbi:MAG: preprotein translocase subunit YajC [Chloroflexota bacterium]